jgi:3-oxoadipate enol-lactonase
MNSMTAMPGAYFDVNDARLYYQTVGAGAPMVLLHGFGLDQRMWEDQAEALADRFLVIRYDQRGYGRSSLPTTQPYSHADDLHGLLTHLKASPAHVVGLSNGGRIALRFTLAYPQSVRSLTLVDAALDGHAWSADWQALWKVMDCTAKAGDVAGAKRLWLEHPLFGAAREQPGVAARLAQMVQDYSGWHWLHSDPGVAAGAPAVQRLSEIRVRTLVMVGERDLPDFHTVADTLSLGIAGAVRVLVPGVGHMINMEAPLEFNRQLIDFVGA